MGIRRFFSNSAADWRDRFIKDIRRTADPRALVDSRNDSTGKYHDPLPMVHLTEAQDAPVWQSEPKAQLSIVLGSFDRLPVLRRSLESIRSNGIRMPYEIIVVDGGSRDGSLEWLINQSDVVTIAQHNRSEKRSEQRRRSWGYFMNLGFRIAQGRWVLMLSDDCVLVRDSVTNAVMHADELTRAGRKIGGVAFYYRNWPEEQEYYVQSTLGGMLMVNHGLFSKEALMKVGYAEEDNYSFYKCDSDLALKMWAAGFEIIDCQKAFVEHLLLPSEKIRIENSSTMARDRAALIERWKGVFVHPDFPFLFKPPGRKTLRFVDESRAAEAFREFVQRPTDAG
jgi:glycosyltransferase involved in cell wall biosynthesis